MFYYSCYNWVDFEPKVAASPIVKERLSKLLGNLTITNPSPKRRKVTFDSIPRMMKMSDSEESDLMEIEARINESLLIKCRLFLQFDEGSMKSPSTPFRSYSLKYVSSTPKTPHRGGGGILKKITTPKVHASV
jgi:hypothetical protein